MSDPHDFPDSSDSEDAVTIPGRKPGPTAVADGGNGADGSHVDSDAMASDAEEETTEHFAVDFASSDFSSDEPTTMPQLERRGDAAGNEPTVRRIASDAGASATLDADRLATFDADPVAAGGHHSALHALLQDIERSFAGAADSSRPGPLIGDANRFQLTARLGSGGMSVVFKAFDHELRRFVAIKLLPRPEGRLHGDHVTRFLLNEARAIAALSHPNIVQVFDISSWCDVPFLIMEYLEGRSLDELMSEPMPVPRALGIAEQLLAGLEHAHRHGVIHRDLKPSNLFETLSGEIKILDFGIASLGAVVGLDGVQRSRLDASLLADSISGTPGYMSPEQWLQPEQDARTDVWAIGVLLVGMLTGVPLFANRNAAAVRDEVLSSRPTLLERDYRIPRPLFRVIEKALEKAPDKRYQSVALLRQALADAALALGHGARPRVAMAPEQRQITIVACRVTIESIVDFEVASDILRTWHNTVAAIVHRGGGFVMTSVGSGILACFGYPAVHEDDAVSAVSVACAIRDMAEEFLRPSERQAKVRIGVDTGFGVVEERAEVVGSVPVLHGAMTQRAVGLRDLAEPGAILLGDSTAKLVRGYFTLTDVFAGDSAASIAGGRVDAPRAGGGTPPGNGAAVAHSVSAIRSLTSRFDAAVLHDMCPLVGREDELEVQDRLWKQVQLGHGKVYCLVGDAGVGKSRLVHRLRLAVTADAGDAFTCQCWPQAAQSSFHPLISLVRQTLRLDLSPSDGQPENVEAQRARLISGLARLGFDSERDIAVFSTLLSIPPISDAPPPTDSAESMRRATIDRLAGLLLRMATRTSVLIAIEDLHWADHSTLDFLDYLLPRIGSQRLLVVLTARRGIDPFWRQHAVCHESELHGLTPELAGDLVRHLHHRLLPGVRLEPHRVEDIVTRSDGLPLYVEELTRAIIERGEVEADRQHSTLPPTLLGLLGTRLDQLHARTRVVVQLGAVLASDFRDGWLQVLLAGTPGAGGALATALDELCDKGIVVRSTSEHGPCYVFRHALLQDVAYQSMPPERRRAAHAQIAELMVRDSEIPRSRSPGGAPTLAVAAPELIAYHYDQADRVAPALQYWERAGTASAKKWAVKEAVGHFTRALQLLETLPSDPARDDTELRLLLALGPPLMSVQGYAAPAVEDTYARAYELCIRQGRQAQTFPPLVGLWQYNMVGGNLAKAATLGTRLLTLAEAVGDRTMRLIAMRALGTTRFLQGDLEAALQYTRAGWDLYDRALHGDLAFRHGNDPGVGHGIYLAWALWHAGYPDQALAQARATLELARSLEHPMSIAFSLCYYAIICNTRGEYLAAEPLLREALMIADQHQLGLWKALALIQLGWSLASRADASGIASMIEGIAAWRQTGARAGTTFFYVALAQAQLHHGDRAAAAASLASARDLIEQNGEHFYEAEMLRTQAALLDPVDQPAAVAELLQRALSLATSHQSPAWRLRLCCDRLDLELGRVERSATAGAAGSGSLSAAVTAARSLLEDCFGWFQEGHDTADLRRAAALLERSDQGADG